MTSIPTTQRICATGNGCNQRAITSCEGCSQRFCQRHFTEHRDQLQGTMNELLREHECIGNSLAEQKKNVEVYQLIKRIHQWETNMIVKVKERSKELQKELAEFAEKYYKEFTEGFQDLSTQINQCRENADFVEMDLQRLKQAINVLRSNFISPATVTIEELPSAALVNNISFNVIKKTSNELFEQIFSKKGRIEENGQLVIHDNSQDPTEIRGKNEYTTGCHHIRLRIEETSGNWLFLGINSKEIPLKSDSCYSPSSYGWSCDNRNWSSGEAQENTCTDRIELRKQDIISLFFDCDDCMITMRNERTGAKHQLPVITDYCPFPWQLHVVLQEPNNRVRILSE